MPAHAGLLSHGAAAGQQAQLGLLLRYLPPTRWASAPTQRQEAPQQQRQQGQRGVMRVSPQWLVNHIFAQVPVHLVRELSRQPGVLELQPNAPTTPGVAYGGLESQDGTLLTAFIDNY